jgi:pentatricopeptide repeat protein
MVCERVVGYAISILGPDDPTTLRIKANLAVAYRWQGQWDRSEEIYVGINDAIERAGSDHDLSLKGSVLAGFARVMHQRGRYHEAEELHHQRLKMYKEEFGDDHPIVFESLMELKILYQAFGRIAEAEQVAAQVMQMSKARLGPDHIVTLWNREAMVDSLCRKGQWEEAERLCAHLLNSVKLKLGENHPGTLITVATRGYIWKNMGRIEEAIPVLRGCVDSLGRILGLNTRMPLGGQRFWQNGNKNNNGNKNDRRAVEEVPAL